MFQEEVHNARDGRLDTQNRERVRTEDSSGRQERRKKPVSTGCRKIWNLWNRMTFDSLRRKAAVGRAIVW